MAAPNKIPAKCAVRSVIRFLDAKGERPAAIHKQTVAVHGNILNLQNMTKWCSELSEGRTKVHDERRSGRPSLISYEILHEIEGEIHANRRVFCHSFMNCGLRHFGNDVMLIVTRRYGLCTLGMRYTAHIKYCKTTF